MYEVLNPISASLKRFLETLPKHSIGRSIEIYTEDGFPDLVGVDLALITVSEGRGSLNEDENIEFETLRRNFYELFPGNWIKKIVDLGTIKAGATIEDTYFAVKLLTESLLKRKIIPIIIGGSQDLTYGMYRAYDSMEQTVNLVSIDNKIDVVNDVDRPSESFMTRIIMETPTNLNNFSTVGYQTYFNSQEELDLVEKMYFEAYRLGEIVSNINISEPIFRDADLISFDINAIKSSDLGFFSKFYPNGFDGREVCALARYAGLSDRVSAFGMFNINNVSEKSLLITQILWYFVEGVNYRMNEYPYISKSSYLKYIVPLEAQELVFYKSDISDRWWMEIGSAEEGVSKRLFPCSYEDYRQALQQVVPERWWKASKKMQA